MNRRLSGKEFSLNAQVGEDGDEWQDWLVDKELDHDLKFAHQEEMEQRKDLLKNSIKVLNQREKEILYSRSPLRRRSTARVARRRPRASPRPAIRRRRRREVTCRVRRRRARRFRFGDVASSSRERMAGNISVTRTTRDARMSATAMRAMGRRRWRRDARSTRAPVSSNHLEI